MSYSGWGSQWPHGQPQRTLLLESATYTGTMLREPTVLVLTSLIVLAACGSRPASPVESVVGAHDVSTFTLKSLNGTRDGERLQVRGSFGNASQTLGVELEFNVTPPARLASGTWTGLGSKGVVRERSVTFLGGQSGAPSIGGRFDLIGPDDRPLFRITIPLQQLQAL